MTAPRRAETEVTGWGRTLRAVASLAHPARAADLAPLAGTGPALGNRRSYGDACVTEGPATLMTGLDRILAFDPGTGEVAVEAGLTIGALARLMAPRGWLPPVMPGTGFATIGGCIAMDVHGKNHHHAGSFGQHVGRLTLIPPDRPAREITAADTEVWQATLGGLGQTGTIARATLRLARTEADVMLVTERRAPDLATHMAMLEDSPAPYVVGWIDATAIGDRLGRGIVEEGETARGLAPPRKAPKSVPLDAPGWALSAPVVRAFNAAYYARVPARGRTVVKPLPDFFFPLDRIHDWNRLYGRQGFHQFQCVVPLAAVDALREMVRAVALSRAASPLAVLKRLGPGRAGHLSFPTEGWTLAVDLPARPGTAALVHRLEDMTRAAGGRTYLAKDSLGRADRVAAAPHRAPPVRCAGNRRLRRVASHGHARGAAVRHRARRQPPAGVQRHRGGP